MMNYNVNHPVVIILNISVSSASEEGETLMFDKDSVTLKKN